jgi:uncharacterized protein
MLLVGLLLAATAPIVERPDDMMDSPRPTASIAAWVDAPGRQRVTLRVPGALLRGYSYAGSDAKAPTLVLFGGSGNLIERHDAAARGFARHASRVVWYDYRGYGFSTGVAHFDDLRADALRIYDATHANTGVVVLGYSMGTDIAEYVAMHRRVAGLILAAPWSDFAAVLRYQDPKHTYRITPPAASDFDERAMVHQIEVPLLVFQGTRDDAIPPTQGRELEEAAASSDKRFVPIAGAKHNGLLENPQSQAAVAEFLNYLRR